MDQQTRKAFLVSVTGVLLAAISALFTHSWCGFLLNITAHCFHLSILEVVFRVYSHLDPLNEENRNIWNSKTITLAVIIITEVVIGAITLDHISQFVPLITSWTITFATEIQFLNRMMQQGRGGDREPEEQENNEVQELALENFHGLDYGSGMAHSFFYGYLRLMLPSPGDERPGLRELIEQYSLQWRRINRAGVQGRQYQHSVYKIWNNGLDQHPVYFCVEYATPLLTLFEIISQNTQDSRMYERYREQLVTNFRTTLQRIINNDRDCRDLVELICYADLNNEGVPYGIDELDVAHLILDRMN